MTKLQTMGSLMKLLILLLGFHLHWSAKLKEIYDAEEDDESNSYFHMGVSPAPTPFLYNDTDPADLIPTEQKLMNDLLRHYEKSVRPVRNASEIVIARMGLTLTQIFDMDEKNQVLVTNVWLDQEWTDIFMRWKPEDYGGLMVIRLPCSKLWLPDIVLYNNAAEYTDGLMPANVMVSHDGNVFWPVPTKLQSSCKVDVTYFPFDQQVCKMKFGSWTYDGLQVDITNRSEEVDLSNYVNNGEWDLVSVEVQRNVVFYPCCREPFPDVTFIVTIRRRNLYYMYNVIFPCIMMSALTLLVFCLPPDSGEKITMGITVLLAFSVFMLRVAENLPETSEFVPLISIYLTVVMAMTSVSVIMTVFVLNLHYRGPHIRPVPQWLKRSFLFTKRKGKKRRRSCAQAHFGESGYYNSDENPHYIKNMSLRLTIENLAQELKDELEHCPSENDTQSTNTEKYEVLYHDMTTNENHKKFCYKSSPYRTNEDILISLKKIIERYQRDDQEEAMIYEWRLVAQSVDRVLFWIFLVGNLTGTVLLLILAPLTKWL